MTTLNPKITGRASQVFGLDPNVVTYGFDIYHGDDDYGDVQFAAATKPYQGLPTKQFCWIKATEGANYVDPHWASHMIEAKRANITTGGMFLPGSYHWVSPNSPARTQVTNFLSTVSKATVIQGRHTLLHMLDIEPTIIAGAKHYPEPTLCLDMAQMIKHATGFYPVLYFGHADYLDRYAATFPHSMYTLNIARYATEDSVPQGDPEVILSSVPCAFQQYTGTGRIQGNSRQQNFDLDVFRGSFAELKAKHTFR